MAAAAGRGNLPQGRGKTRTHTQDHTSTEGPAAPFYIQHTLHTTAAT